MITITQRPSDDIEGAVEVSLKTIVTTKTVIMSEFAAHEFMNKVVITTLYWFDSVPNLIEQEGGELCEGSPDRIILGFDYANKIENDSKVLFRTVQEGAPYSKRFIHRGFNRAGLLGNEVETLLSKIERTLNKLEGGLKEELPRYVLYNIIQEAKNNGFEYDFGSFEDDITVMYIRRKLLHSALCYLRTPYAKDMASRELFGGGEGL